MDRWIYNGSGITGNCFLKDANSVRRAIEKIYFASRQHIGFFKKDTSHYYSGPFMSLELREML